MLKLIKGNPAGNLAHIQALSHARLSNYAARRKQPVLIKDGHRLIGHLSCTTP